MCRFLARFGTLLIALAMVGGVGSRAHAQEEGADAPAHVRAEARKVERGGEEYIRVDVLVENVSDLGAFEFILKFDGSLLEVSEDSIEEGPFLATSGRETFCQSPSVDSNALRYACVTLGEQPRAGAEGGGLLASVYFKPKGEGDAPIEFDRAQLANPPGDRIEAVWESGRISVAGAGGGSRWWVWAAVAAGLSAIFVAIFGVTVVIARRRAVSERTEAVL